MTSQAVLRQPEPGTFDFLVLSPQRSWIDNVFGVVALATLEFRVSTGYLIPQFVVLEFVLAIGPEDQIVIAPVVVAVTIDANCVIIVGV